MYIVTIRALAAAEKRLSQSMLAGGQQAERLRNEFTEVAIRILTHRKRNPIE